MAKRVRRFSISRNKQYETHQLDGQDTAKVGLKFQIRIERKVKSETLEYLAMHGGSLKSNCFDFHDRDLTSDGEDCIVVHSGESLENPVTITSL